MKITILHRIGFRCFAKTEAALENNADNNEEFSGCWRADFAKLMNAQWKRALRNFFLGA